MPVWVYCMLCCTRSKEKDVLCYRVIKKPNNSRAMMIHTYTHTYHAWVQYIHTPEMDGEKA